MSACISILRRPINSHRRASRATFPLLMMAILGGVTACQNPNEIALKVGEPPAEALNLRVFETRQYEGADQVALLQAGLATFQDLGFTATETASDVGVIAGSKQRDAHETGQVVGAVILGLLFGASSMQYDVSQDIHVTFVSTSLPDHEVSVRVSFDRYITDNKGMLHTTLVTDSKVYSDFFDKLQVSLAAERGRV